MNNNILKIRSLSRFIIETETPLMISSGDKGILTDSFIVTDTNDLPFISGTSLCGVLKHFLEETEVLSKNEANDIFGVQLKSKSVDSHGSNIIFSDAKLVLEDGNIAEGVMNLPNSEYYTYFRNLPIRQHAKINDRGATIKGGKFDNQVVYKGTRLCFEMEMLSSDSGYAEEYFNKILSALHNNSIRIGGGVYNGFGAIKVVECRSAILDLTIKENLSSYLTMTSSLNDMAFWNNYNNVEIEAQDSTKWEKYTVELSPDDFFYFGSGFGDDDVDMTPMSEDVVVWDANKPRFMKENILIPATSIKGALSHRVAYHYNRLRGWFNEDTAKVYSANEAVKELFGGGDEDKLCRGNVIISDIIVEKECEDKIFNHVKIDYFTGGAIDGALFSEKATYMPGAKFILEILVRKEAFNEEKVKESFEAAIGDLCDGLLPLGGAVNRGHGVFTGKILNA